MPRPLTQIVRFAKKPPKSERKGLLTESFPIEETGETLYVTFTIRPKNNAPVDYTNEHLTALAVASRAFTDLKKTTGQYPRVFEVKIKY